jgi:galactonate dehydratase
MSSRNSSIISSIEVHLFLHFLRPVLTILPQIFRVPPRWLFVRVETSDGIVGWGEATLEGHTEAIEGAFKDLSERFIGSDADNIQDIWQTAYRGRFYRGGPVLMVGLTRQ